VLMVPTVRPAAAAGVRGIPRRHGNRRMKGVGLAA